MIKKIKLITRLIKKYSFDDKKWNWYKALYLHFNAISNLLGHIQKLIQVDTSEGELPEGPLLLESFVYLKNKIKQCYYKEENLTFKTSNFKKKYFVYYGSF